MLLFGSCCVWGLLIILVATFYQSWHGRGDRAWALMRAVIITAWLRGLYFMCDIVEVACL